MTARQILGADAYDRAIVDTHYGPVRSIGDLERAAGVGASHLDRFAFWRPYARVAPPGAALDAGCRELRRRAIARLAHA